MKVVLFDLGDTLEHDDVLLPGAREVLTAVSGLSDSAGDSVQIGVISDFTMPQAPSEIPAIRQEYQDLLKQLGLLSFFSPDAKRVTLSTEVGKFKPDRKIFRAALDKFAPALRFADALFVTENQGHVAAARRLGMEAVHFQGPGQTTGEIQELAALVPIVEAWLAAPAPPRADWASLEAAVSDRGGSLRELRANANREHLHLVVQQGRLFQRAHPEVPVLLDRGRYLLVQLPPEEAERLDPGDAPCYSVRPVEEGDPLFGTVAATSARAPVPWIQELVDRVAQPAYEADLVALASFPTRLSTGPEFLQAVDRVRRQFTEMGYTIEIPSFPVGSGTSRNVIAERVGAGPAPRRVVLVTAHLDSINEAGPTAPAPGADDNASGSAGVLEIARVFQSHAGVHDLRFILFGGEEQGLHGSRRYVASLSSAERQRIQAVVNMDMIGTLNVTPAGVLIEGRSVAQALIDGLAEAASTYTTLSVQTSLQAADSDHVPFLQVMIPAVLTIEGADRTNEHIHSADDTLDHIQYDLAQEILRMNVAFVAATIGSATG